MSTETESEDDATPCTYLCGNSLGLQPRAVQKYTQAQLSLWATKGVYGHFKEVSDSLVPPWLHIDDVAAGPMARVVGALPGEVAVMNTLTANLHLLMASFYRPDGKRYKIVIESKAFPSDHFAVESQLRHHGLDPAEALVLLEPPPDESSLLPTSHILSQIQGHAETTALLLLPGVQFYTGQYFDMAGITAFAQSKGIMVGWDLAHAVGNVLLRLHDWGVDFAAWCNYKYMNSGPGAIAGLFVHERHGGSKGAPESSEAPNGVVEQNSSSFRHRLSGWWGSDKASRFAMTNRFDPIPGAAGFQLSNPSALDLSAVLASLSIFEQIDVEELRVKSLKLTGYLEELLDSVEDPPYDIITPRDPAERGAQLSIRLNAGLLDRILPALADEAVIVDERKPDVIRVAPAPLYNSFEDCWRFVDAFRRAWGG